MSKHPAISWTRPGLPLVAAGLVLVVAAVIGVRKWLAPANPPTSQPPLTQTYPGLDLEDPAASFETLRYTADTGGNENTRAQSIVWLDQQTRTMQPLSPRQEGWILDMLTAGGHPQWDKEYKFWVFNSAFNTLHLGPRQEDLTRLLKHLAVHDPEKTMRLYAIQHLEVQRANGRLDGHLADEVRALFLQIAAAPDGEEAGLAIRFLVGWNGVGTAVSPDVTEKAIQLAGDPSRSVDVRVTALHAAGSAALGLARDFASAPSQPTLLRKASIALIGQHGDSSDLTHLQKLSAENSRLAQAATPAMEAICHRASNSHPRQLIPF